jgi:hypothetical protein
MVTVEPDRSAALLIRVWLEGSGGTEVLRARLTSIDTTGAESDDANPTVALASTVSGVMDAVRDWLDQLVSPETPGD